MTSAVRYIAEVTEGLTRFLKPESPSYNLSILEGDRLFPFTCRNGVLDITYEGNTFKSRMVDRTGGDPGSPINRPESETGTCIRIMGSGYQVHSLGNNFKEYIRAWRIATIDAGSPIEIHIAPVMLRVQEADVNNINADSSDSYLISTSAPSGDNYVDGNESNKYRTTYIFKTPLTFTIVEDGITKYITFRTNLDQE
jgi:hypothetical protein